MRDNKRTVAAKIKLGCRVYYSSLTHVHHGSVVKCTLHLSGSSGFNEWEEVDGEIGNVQIAWFGQGGERCDGGRDHERLFDLFIGTSSIHGMGFGMERQMNTPFYTGQLMV